MTGSQEVVGSNPIFSTVGPWGQNATLGFGIDGNDDWFWIGSDGLSMGLDASIGISSSLYLPWKKRIELTH